MTSAYVRSRALYAIEPKGSPTALVTPPSGIHQVWGIRKEPLVRRSIFNRTGLAAIAGCVAVGSLALAGCGGGGSSSTTGASGTSGAAGTTPLSQDEFVSQANAACTQYNDAVGALKHPSSSSMSDIAAYTAQLLPLENRTY